MSDISNSKILNNISTLTQSQTKLHIAISKLLDAKILLEQHLQATLKSKSSRNLAYSPAFRRFGTKHSNRSVPRDLGTKEEEADQQLLTQMEHPTLPWTSITRHQSNCELNCNSLTKHQGANEQNWTSTTKPQSISFLLEQRHRVKVKLEACFAALDVVSFKFSQLVMLLEHQDDGRASQRTLNDSARYRPSYYHMRDDVE